MNAALLKVLIWNVINIWRSDVTVEDLQMNFTEIYTDNSVRGFLSLTSTTIPGIETVPVDIDIETIVVEEPDADDNNNVCIEEFPVANLQFVTRYLADVGIRNAIPFYGEGNFELAIKDTNAKICFYAVTQGSDIVHIENLNIILTYLHGPITLDGFLKNPQANEIFSNYLNFVNVIFAMWNKYEPEKFSCISSPPLQYMVNAYLGHFESAPSLNVAECLQGSALEDYINFSEEEIWKFMWLVINYFL